MTAPISPHQVTGVPPAGTDNTPWKSHANCAGEDWHVFFTERFESLEPARRICAACIVREKCLEFALTENMQYGVWGGTSLKERRKIRADRARARLASPSAATARATGGVPSAVRPRVDSARPPGRTAHHP